MYFPELNSENFILFAISNHINPQAITIDDFEKDLDHFKYIKRLLRKYKKTGILNINLLLKHFTILYNVFGDAATPMLFYKLDVDLISEVKTFILVLNRLPEYPLTEIHNIPVNMDCYRQLQKLFKDEQ